MNDRTFLIVKPDGVQRKLIGKIIARWEAKGFKLAGLKFLIASKDIASEHYAEHKGKNFYDGLVSFIISGPIVVMVWEGKDAVAASRLMIGSTNPGISPPGTVRGDFALDMPRNIIHGSDSKEAAIREINLWFKSDELQSWESHDKKYIYA